MWSASPIRTAADTKRTVSCNMCGVDLPLYILPEMERPSIWLCAGCGAFYLAYPDTELILEHGSLVRLHDQHFQTDGSSEIPAHMRLQIANVIKRSSQQVGLELRRSSRVSNPMMIAGLEMNYHLQAYPRAIDIMMVDISREGIGLAMVNGTQAPYLALKLPSPGGKWIQVIARVVRQRELMPPYVNVGCEFICRLGD